MKSVEVRSELTDALKLDLVGPSERLGSPTEVLPQAPARFPELQFLLGGRGVRFNGIRPTVKFDLESKQMSEARPNEKRQNQRMALAAHLAGSMLRAWGEQFPDARKLSMRSVYLADYILAVLDSVPEGEIDPTKI